MASASDSHRLRNPFEDFVVVFDLAMLHPRRRARHIALIAALVAPLAGCSTHEGATQTCKTSEVDAKCEICCAENGASGFTYYGRGRCTCLH